MKSKMQTLTLKQLLGKWHRFQEPITREEIDLLDWDELMLSLHISCPEAEEGPSVIIDDVDMTTYNLPAVIFGQE